MLILQYNAISGERSLTLSSVGTHSGIIGDWSAWFVVRRNSPTRAVLSPSIDSSTAKAVAISILVYYKHHENADSTIVGDCKIYLAPQERCCFDVLPRHESLPSAAANNADLSTLCGATAPASHAFPGNFRRKRLMYRRP